MENTTRIADIGRFGAPVAGGKYSEKPVSF